MRTKACTIQPALERNNQRFFLCVLETPERGGFNGKLDCKSGAAFFLAADVSKKWYSRHGWLHVHQAVTRKAEPRDPPNAECT